MSEKFPGGFSFVVTTLKEYSVLCYCAVFPVYLLSLSFCGIFLKFSQKNVAHINTQVILKSWTGKARGRGLFVVSELEAGIVVDIHLQAVLLRW